MAFYGRFGDAGQMFHRFFGFFTGNLIGGFLPKDFVYRDGVLMLAGFGCYPVLDFIEKNLPTLAERLVDKFMSK